MVDSILLDIMSAENCKMTVYADRSYTTILFSGGHFPGVLAFLGVQPA